ncbi:MAG: cation-transporting P-type ATPase [Synechococcaceae cyanobacterium]|nr:cation-transporting P-type ATPase [Synechococcaceae cyanobacterium]
MTTGQAPQGEFGADLRDRLEALRRRLARLGEEAAADDMEPILRSVMEIAAELVGVGAGLGLRGTREGTRLGINLAAALRALETLPNLRRSLDQLLGPGSVELLLKLLDSVDQALLQGLAGAVVSLFEEALQLRARMQHRRRRRRFGAEGVGIPEAAPTEPPVVRPVPLPPGPIERYAEQAAMLSLGAFGFGLTASRDLAGAEAAVLGGLPRPALLGRTAFCVEVGRRLEEMGSLLLDPEALECLDRIDTVVIDRSLLDGRWGSTLLAAARDAGLLRVLAAPPGAVVRGEVERRIPTGEAAKEAVRALQTEGRVVLLLAGAELPAVPADLGVAFGAGDRREAAAAHILAAEAPGPAWLLFSALGPARRCSSQSVQAALMEVVAGMTLCLDGLSEKATLQVNQVAQLLALVAMGNGLRLARRVDPAPPRPADDTVPWHSLAVEEVMARLASGPEGLPDDSPGESEPPSPAPPQGPGLPGLVMEELDTPLVPILGGGAILSALMGSPGDAGLILAVLGLNACIGAAQRLRVERALAGLQTHAAAPVWVRRGGRPRRVDGEALRVGDLVLLEAGEVVPADCRLVRCSGLQVDEAVLTGESFPVVKAAEPCRAAALAERHSMVYQGTTVVAGDATAVVVAVDEATEARRGLAAARHAATAGGVEARLEGLTAITTPIASFSGAALLLAALARGQDPRQALSEAVALAVAAVPEGLPVLSGLAQFAAAGRLSEHRVLVRNPRAIEALGRVQVICLDKTGTLTSGRIELVCVWAAGRSLPLEELDDLGREVLRIALRATPEPEPGKSLAHPTDRATRRGAERAGVDGGAWTQLEALPFEPGRGFHASRGHRRGETLLCVKGAPEVVLAACSRHHGTAGLAWLEEGKREQLAATARELAEQGLRVLAVARRRLEGDLPLDDGGVRDLEFLGLVALADPIRPTARAALDDLRRAGITVKLITGDHPATAAAIAEDLALPSDGSVLTGPEIDAMAEEDLQQAALRASVFARVTSLQKLRLVRALRQAGLVVAMTGDGANDAPAIRLAEVGIALGEKATEAARQAADIVVTDGSIETIVRAVLEGRALWRSVREAVALLVGGNLGEIGFTLYTGLREGEPALNTRQLLLLNLLTDVAPALAIAVQPPGQLDPEELLREGPEASLGRSLDRDILRRAAVTALTSGLARSLAARTGERSAADTVGLLTLVATQLGQMVATGRTDPLTLVTGVGSAGALLAAVQTPGLSQAFGCRPLGPLGLLQAGAASALGTGAGLVLPWLEAWITPPAGGSSRSRSADSARPG